MHARIRSIPHNPEFRLGAISELGLWLNFINRSMRREYKPHAIYKDHYACFQCRKAFKQPNVLDLPEWERPRRDEQRVIPCPECGEAMHNMGHAFKPPRRNAIKQWEKVEILFHNGIRFDFNGWAGPGYRPETMRELEPFLKDTRFKTKKLIEVQRKEIATRRRKRSTDS